MKTKLFKKIAAVFTSAVVAASVAAPALSMTAFADTQSKINPVAGTGDYDNYQSIALKKGINMRNVAEGRYNQPDITFSFSIAPYTYAQGDSKFVVKGTDEAVEVLDGVPNSVFFSKTGETLNLATTVTYSSGETYTINSGDTENGVVVTKTFNLYVDASKFSKPGIYRYVLTDNTENSALFAAGITRSSTYINTRYIDLYIKNNDSNGRELASAVVYNSNKSYTTGETNGKCQGFEATNTSSSTGTQDNYRTYNILVKKLITGDLADMSHEFPFTVVVNNSNTANTFENGSLSNTNKTYYYSKNDTSSFTPTTSTTVSTTLGNNGLLYIRGLTPKAQICVGERNDTNETYKVTVIGSDGSSTGSDTTFRDAVTMNVGDFTRLNDLVDEHVSTSAITDYDSVNAGGTPSTIASPTNVRNLTFTNNATSISPTGVVLRFGAFAMIAAFGVIFFIVSRRSKAKKDNTDVI